MAETRDEQTELLIDIQKIIGAENPYDAVTLARYVEHRETKLRRQIADELADMRSSSSGLNRTSALGQSLRIYIEKLRGKQ